jgi:hypothetical protein
MGLLNCHHTVSQLNYGINTLNCQLTEQKGLVCWDRLLNCQPAEQYDQLAKHGFGPLIYGISQVAVSLLSEDEPAEPLLPNA